MASYQSFSVDWKVWIDLKSRPMLDIAVNFLTAGELLERLHCFLDFQTPVREDLDQIFREPIVVSRTLGPVDLYGQLRL